MALRVIGAGLGRTGTASLKLALERLGVGRCYHMGEVMRAPADAKLWIDAARGAPDWDGLLGDYGATVDYPACNFWSQLAELYPRAKILLSVRDSAAWFESTQQTIFSPSVCGWIRKTPLAQFFAATTWSEFGHRIHDRDFMIDYFERRNRAIQASVPAERLLVYRVSDGWAPLCEFLDLPIPDEAFPYVNSREETARLLKAMTDAQPGVPLEEQLRRGADELFDASPKI